MARSVNSPWGGPVSLLRHPMVQAALVVWLVFAALTASDRFGLSLFGDNYFMSITMAFGSLIAGATSEGGGAVAFPVMTLVFEIPPPVARDFGLLIQSVGMTAAGWTIWRLRISVEGNAIVWSSLGGGVGVCLGISVIAPCLAPPAVKLFFVSLWLSFGVALLWLNRRRDRAVAARIEGFGARHAVLFAAVGGVGGCVSGLTGSGLDIVTFSLLTLTFRIDEKVATPTSVVLMGINAAVGAAWRATGGAATLGPIDAVVVDYVYCCMAIVVVGAPLGARLIARRPRLQVVWLLLATIAVQFVGGLVVVPKSGPLWLLVAGTLLGGLALFGAMLHFGRRALA